MSDICSLQAMPESVASPYGQWPEQATRELQLGAMPPDLQHALHSGTEDGLLNPQLRWALSVRLCLCPLPGCLSLSNKSGSDTDGILEYFQAWVSKL